MGQTKPFDTPTKAKIRGVVEYLEFNGIPYRKAPIYDFFEVSRMTGYRIIRSKSDRVHPEHEARGTKRKLSESDLDAIEELYNEGFEAKRLSWAGQAAEAGVCVDISDRTVQRRMQERGYFKRIARTVAYVDPAIAAARLNLARYWLQRYPEPKDWYSHRFTDEVHFGFGDCDKAHISRKKGEAYAPGNLQEQEEPEEKDKKRLHAWAAVGYNFKSDLTFYTVPTNSNGKMTQQVYIDHILEPNVGKWIDEGQDFILVEDNDSGHGPKDNGNKVRRWKEARGVRSSYFNAPRSPDLNPIENCWNVPKQHLRAFGLWDDEALMTLVVEGWDKLEISTINGWIDSMVKRLQQVVEREGKMTGW